MRTTFAVCVFTDGRRECIEQTIASFNERVIFPAAHPGFEALGLDESPHVFRWMFDDSADPEYGEWLNERFPEWAQWPTHVRLGFGGTINRAWRHIVRGPKVDYVFHLEDDFIFNEDVFIEDMQHILDIRPPVAQVALKRQPIHPAEIAAGGFMEQWPQGYEAWDSNARGSHDVTWVEERLFFTTNPSLYRAALCRRGWPAKPRSEPLFTKRLFANPEITSAFLHDIGHPPVVHHIGDVRAGRGY